MTCCLSEIQIKLGILYFYFLNLVTLAGGPMTGTSTTSSVWGYHDSVRRGAIADAVSLLLSPLDLIG